MNVVVLKDKGIDKHQKEMIGNIKSIGEGLTT